MIVTFRYRGAGVVPRRADENGLHPAAAAAAEFRTRDLVPPGRRGGEFNADRIAALGNLRVGRSRVSRAHDRHSTTIWPVIFG
jgi:hypothetical protein